MNIYKESKSKETSYKQKQERRVTGLVISSIGTFF